MTKKNEFAKNENNIEHHKTGHKTERKEKTGQ